MTAAELKAAFWGKIHACKTAAELQALAYASPAAHMACFVQVLNKEGELEILKPNTLQLRMSQIYETCAALALPCRMVVCKIRQCGGTEMGLQIGYHHSMKRRVRAIAISDKRPNSKKLVKRLAARRRTDTFPWGIRLREVQEEVFFSNESYWEIESAENHKAGIGDTRQFALFSEVAKWPKTTVVNDESIMGAVMPSIAKTGFSCAVAESTPDGACYDPETEVLTDQGWKRFAELDGSESILTKDLKTGRAYYQPEWKHQVHDHEGDMIRVQTRTVDLLVTPNHKIWTARQKGKMKFMDASDMLRTSTDFYFERSFDIEQPGIETFTLPEFTYNRWNKKVTKPPVEIPMDVWLQFLGHWLSDGGCMHRPRPGKFSRREVYVTQVKFVERFRESCERLGKFLHGNIKEIDHGGGKRWIIRDCQLSSYLCAYSQPKRIPRELLMALSRDQCRQLIAAIYEGDGDQSAMAVGQIHRGKVYVGLDKEFQDDLQELCLKAGFASSVWGPDRNRMVTFSENRRAKVAFTNPPTVEHGYSGKVYCVSLPADHLLMVRRSGKAVWCGNSGWHYTKYTKEAVSFEEFLARVTRGERPIVWIKVFAGWYEFEENRLSHLTGAPPAPAQIAEMKRSLSPREHAGMRQYAWDWDQVAWRRAMISMDCNGDEDIFDAYYPEDDVRCWAVSGRPRFNMQMLMTLERRISSRRMHAGYLTIQTSDEVTFAIDPEGGGDILLWEEPLRGCRYLVACDPATGASNTHGADPDRNSVQVWRQGYADETGMWINAALVARVRSPNTADGDDVAMAIVKLSRYFGNCLVVLEVNQGIHVLDHLTDAGVPLFRRAVPSLRPGVALEQFGFKLTDQEQRRQVIEGLAAAIREGQIDVWDQNWIDEAKTFITTPGGRYEARPGCHDDDTMCGAMAWLALPGATEYRGPIRRRKGPPDRKDWRRFRGAATQWR